MNPYEKAQRKAKFLSGIVIIAILLWTTSLFFSKTTLIITIGLVFLHWVVQLVWFLYQMIKDEMTAFVWSKEQKRRWR